jgi:glycosyltransferase involved in cell wall biosynthesis
MKIAHWTAFNKSGMHRVAESIQLAEQALGIDSVLCQYPTENVEEGMNADINVCHTHLPEPVRRKGSKKLVYVAHGTPETVFDNAVDSVSQGYGHGDAWMLLQYWLQHSDARVTFWPRHQKILKSLCDKHTSVDYVPLGLDKEFWKPVKSQGKFAGNPSVLCSENAYKIKWPLDLCIAWPWISEKAETATLHINYLPHDQHRWWFPLVNRNGCSYSSYIGAWHFDNVGMRNALCSIDFYISPVKYGDFNRMSLEAKACGTKLISYTGNPYADYWVSEGDQRVFAQSQGNRLKLWISLLQQKR